MTVREAVLRVILSALRRKDYCVEIDQIHSAHDDHPYSGTQRLRELRKEGVVVYQFVNGFYHETEKDEEGEPVWIDYKHYDFTGTKIRDVKKALKGGR